MLELKAIIVDVVRKFEFEPLQKEEDLELENYLTLRPRGGLRVRFRRAGEIKDERRDSGTGLEESGSMRGKPGYPMRNRKTSAWLA